MYKASNEHNIYSQKDLIGNFLLKWYPYTVFFKLFCQQTSHVWKRNKCLTLNTILNKLYKMSDARYTRWTIHDEKCTMHVTRCTMNILIYTHFDDWYTMDLCYKASTRRYRINVKVAISLAVRNEEIVESKGRLKAFNKGGIPLPVKDL